MDRIQRINSRFKYENEGRSFKHNQMMDVWLVQALEDLLNMEEKNIWSYSYTYNCMIAHSHAKCLLNELRMDAHAPFSSSSSASACLPGLSSCPPLPSSCRWLFCSPPPCLSRFLWQEKRKTRKWCEPFGISWNGMEWNGWDKMPSDHISAERKDRSKHRINRDQKWKEETERCIPRRWIGAWDRRILYVKFTECGESRNSSAPHNYYNRAGYFCYFRCYFFCLLFLIFPFLVLF